MGNTNLEWAKFYASQGWNVVPTIVYGVETQVKGERGPVIKKKPQFPFGWTDSPTTDEATLTEWFDEEKSHPLTGIAINTGPESNLLIIDVDNEYAWDMLITDLNIPEPVTYTVQSQSGKKQFYFRWPEGLSNAAGRSKKLLGKTVDEYDKNGSRVPRGVDVLEVGNVVFAPPTQVVSADGEVYGEYTLLNNAPLAELPKEILDFYLASNGRRSSGSGASFAGERPVVQATDMPEDLDPKKAQFQLDKILAWCQFEFNRLATDTGSFWDNGVTKVMGVLVRVVNSPWFDFNETDLDGFLASYAPEDSGFTHSDHMRIKNSIFRGADGAALAYDPTEYDAEVEAMEIYRQWTQSNAKAKGIGTKNGLLPNIPEEFWSRRKLFGQIRQFAWFRGAPADATLHSFLAAYAAEVPHQYQVETGIGSPANICYFSAIAGSSGAGKGRSTSVGLKIADTDLPKPPLGTGEGIAEYFLDNVPDEDNPKNFRTDKEGNEVMVANPTMKKVQGRHNLLLVETEGKSLGQLNGRAGASLSTVLLKLGMGEDLGNLNASSEANRHVPGGSYSVGLIMGFQIQVAGELLDQTETGLAQRFLWASTNDVYMPDEDVEQPLAIDFNKPVPVQTGWQGADVKKDITVHPSIVATLRAEDRAVVKGQRKRDPFDSHKPVRMLQLAAILRMLEGPNLGQVDQRSGQWYGTDYQITEEDWELAGILFEASSQVRRSLVAAVQEHREHEVEEMGKKDAKRSVARQEAEGTEKVNALVKRTLEVIDSLVEKGKTTTWGNISQGWSSATTKTKVKDVILPALVEDGTLTLNESGHYLRAEPSDD